MTKLFLLFALIPTFAGANDIILGHGTGLIYNKDAPKYGRTYSTYEDCGNLPDEFDLRDEGVVPPIRDQGACGSCWAFSKTASLESAYALANGEILDLSEQELVSCDKKQYGCQGGFLTDFDYQITKGQGLESDFPYTARDSKCKEIAKKAKGTEFHYVGSPDRSPTEKEVMCALFHSKTIPWTVVAAEGQWGKAPTSDNGIMSICGARNINHAVGLVGWKKINGKVYFKVRNSWGNDWGSTAGRTGSERGYTLAAHKCNLLNDEVAYIVTDKSCKPPVIDVPNEIKVNKNQDTFVSLKTAEDSTDYTWYLGRYKVGTGKRILLNHDRPTTLKVKAKNQCGKSETLIKVEINQ
jgi:hypothetical protein